MSLLHSDSMTYKVIIIFLSITMIVVLKSSGKLSLNVVTSNVVTSNVDHARDLYFKPSIGNADTYQEEPANIHQTYMVAIGNKNITRNVRDRTRNGMKTPLILIWQFQPFMKKAGDKHLEYLLSYQCGGCHVTTERGRLAESIAVIIYNYAENRTLDLPDPKLRNPNQVYVFWNRETPGKTHRSKSVFEDSRFDSIFNLTFNYRRDSDVRHYFGNRELALRFSKSKWENIGEILQMKSKLVIWFVSNCDHVHGAILRMKYAKELVGAGLKLDKYGNCFHNRYTDKIYDELHQYKFYLAFENSLHCPDYLTEKFWKNSLDSGVVPIVWGPTKADVEAVAPPNSFIHVEDFKSPRELVDYIEYLDGNHDAYMEYHKWREAECDYTIPEENIARGAQASMCMLCKRQMFHKYPPKTIPSVTKWLYETGFTDDQCLAPPDSISEEELFSLTNF